MCIGGQKCLCASVLQVQTRMYVCCLNILCKHTDKNKPTPTITHTHRFASVHGCQCNVFGAYNILLWANGTCSLPQRMLPAMLILALYTCKDYFIFIFFLLHSFIFAKRRILVVFISKCDKMFWRLRRSKFSFVSWTVWQGSDSRGGRERGGCSSGSLCKSHL